jgi:hypothetical protein
MTDTLSAAELRDWATRCLERANDACREAQERSRLLRMSASLLHLAETSDWLDGKDEDPMAAGC